MIILQYQKELDKKYGIAAVISCAIIAGVLAFAYHGTNQTNSVVPSTQQNTTSSAGTNQPPTTTSITGSTTPTGRHFSTSVNETVTVKSNP